MSHIIYSAERQPARLSNALKDCKDWVDQEVEQGRDRGEALTQLLAKVRDHCSKSAYVLAIDNKIANIEKRITGFFVECPDE